MTSSLHSLTAHLGSIVAQSLDPAECIALSSADRSCKELWQDARAQVLKTQVDQRVESINTKWFQDKQVDVKKPAQTVKRAIALLNHYRSELDPKQMNRAALRTSLEEKAPLEPNSDLKQFSLQVATSGNTALEQVLLESESTRDEVLKSAATEGYSEVALALLALGTISDQARNQAFQIASVNEHYEIMLALLETGTISNTAREIPLYHCTQKQRKRT